MAVTFDSSPLSNPSWSIKASDEHFECTIECMTDTYSEITDLRAKAGFVRRRTLQSGKTGVRTTGTLGTLSLDGTEYTNCAIEGEIPETEVSPIWWKYTVKFVQDKGA